MLASNSTFAFSSVHPPCCCGDLVAIGRQYPVSSKHDGVEAVCNEIINIAEKSVHYCSTVSDPLDFHHKVSPSDNKSSLIISQQPQAQQRRVTPDRSQTSQDLFSYQALYSYIPQNDDELELRDGDIVDVMEKCDDGWFVDQLSPGFSGKALLKQSNIWTGVVRTAGPQCESEIKKICLVLTSLLENDPILPRSPEAYGSHYLESFCSVESQV
ncbi:hypothetical protein P7K49_024171 [Saguinus oedipus]|uniref:SH3 domain-containing protein n=1 Tax=Saguinus oedipus TaxID=9490 RepID=A0ABQ9UNS8_SAGOE|nr:hypothetical protein P7K49_024171 [Saguinus oedipus]